MGDVSDTGCHRGAELERGAKGHQLIGTGSMTTAKEPALIRLFGNDNNNNHNCFRFSLGSPRL